MAYKIVNDDSLTSVANAIRVQGSISGTLEFPDGFVSAIQNLSPSPTLQTKTKTYTPTTSQQTESVVADSGYDGLDEVDVTVNAIPSQYKDTTDATATADKILQGYTAYANGQKLVGTASGGITPSGTISITQNGQVDVTNYATADVNVSGGGGGVGTLIATKSLGHITVTSTSHTSLGISVSADVRGYDGVILVVKNNSKINDYHYLTAEAIWFTESGAKNTTPLNNIAISSSGSEVGQFPNGLYGIYTNSFRGNKDNLTMALAGKFSSSYTKTIDSDYTAYLYGVIVPR